ncbi:hypothetical protein K469DRAFT_711125 [Zopfia rhizophila CBS 207.26]|uniref:FAD-binding FR-type domain-containing protein n=1 Tax=Zopfia rhizophila CBS 207.26 TaxID=1314779 RepID=A0A6A6DYX1_9PEZI|nr:hypothetical protein K469DRAFT_711125 [Zopfia rhizophila CBS 207.26]
MTFGYEFVTLEKPQRHERRLALDFYAQIAQWSVLVVFALFQLSFFLSWLAKQGLEYERPRSPSFNKRGDGKWTWLKNSRQGVERLSWWMKRPVFPNWGTRGEWIFGGIWMAWLLYLCINGTGNDYLHLTKRFGIIGGSQLPLHYLLAMRSPYSPVQLLTRLSHEQLKASHKTLGRIIYTLFALHACFYLNFFVRTPYTKRLKDADVIFGIVSITLFSILSTTALGVLRRWNYRVFYISHVLIAGVVIPLLYLHVHHIRPYIVEVFVIQILHQIFRNWSLNRYSGTIKLLPGTNLVQVRIPLTAPSSTLKWKAGQHVYLSRPSGDSPPYSTYDQFITRNYTNPFTIASIPAKDKELLLVARTLNGNTKELAQLAKSLSSHIGADGPLPSISLALEGPYGASSHLPDFSVFGKVLLIAGGVGATFVMPLYRSIVEHEGSDSSQQPQIRFVWAVRKLTETQWAFPVSNEDESAAEVSSHSSTVEVCVTRPSGPNLQADDSGDDIELAEDDQLLSMEEQMEKPRRGMTLKTGRPEISAIVDDVFSKATGRVAVVACGPKALIKELSNRVEHWVSEGHDVYWHDEAFGW